MLKASPPKVLLIKAWNRMARMIKCWSMMGLKVYGVAEAVGVEDMAVGVEDMAVGAVDGVCFSLFT
jgi:hypothetical protein